MKKLALLVCIATMAIGVNVYALDFGDNITIFDKNGSGSDWYGTQEDQEVEPGMQRLQKWDLEGFFQDDDKLTMVGGYNFVTGATASYGQLMSGDIFIDVDGDAQYGDIHGTSKGIKVVQERNGYDFVLDMHFDTLTYNVLQLTDHSRTQTSYEKQNQGSNPWRYYDGGIDLGISGNIEYLGDLSHADTGFTGKYHNAATVDLGFLSEIDLSGYTLAETFTTHFTMECGNDNLMGSFDPTSPVPEPSTVLLLGAGLLGLVGYGKSRRKK